MPLTAYGLERCSSLQFRSWVQELRLSREDNSQNSSLCRARLGRFDDRGGGSGGYSDDFGVETGLLGKVLRQVSEEVDIKDLGIWEIWGDKLSEV